MSWRTKGRGRSARHFQPRPRRTLYGPAKDQALASDVHASSAVDARDSADQLMLDFRSAKTAAQKEKVWRATQEESSRLYVDGHNHNNSAASRKRLLEEHAVFRDQAKAMHDDLVKEGAFGEGGR